MSLIRHIPLLDMSLQDTCGNIVTSVPIRDSNNFAQKEIGGPFGSYISLINTTVNYSSINKKHTKLSIAFWFKPIYNNSSTGMWHRFIQLGTYNDNYQNEYLRFCDNQSSSYRLFGNNVFTGNAGFNNLSITPQLVPNNTWAHVIFTIEPYNDKTLCKLYINGEYINEQITDYTGGQFNESVFLIGDPDTHNVINDRVGFCDLRIYDHILTTYEIKDLQKRELLHYTFNQFLPENVESLINGENTLNRTWDAENNAWKYLPTETNYGYQMLFPRVNYLKANTSYVLECECYNTSTNGLLQFHKEAQLSEFKSWCSDFTPNWNSYKLTCDIKNKWVKFWCVFETTNDISDQRLLFYPIPNDGSFTNGYQLLRNVKIYEGSEYVENGICSGKVYDVSGHGTDAQIANITSTNNCVLGNNAAQFNGSHFIAVSNVVKPIEAFTINIWAYKDDWSIYCIGGNTTNERIISCTESGGWTVAENQDGYIQYAAYNPQTNSYITAKSNVTFSSLDSGWHMFTMTFNGTTLTGYLDKTLIVSADGFNGSISYNSTAGLFIGAEAGSSATVPETGYFNGKIDDVRIYASCLNEKDIIKLYNKKASLFGNKLIISNIKEECDISIKSLVNSKGILETPSIIENKYFYTKDGAKFLKIFDHDIRYNKDMFSTDKSQIEFEVNKINQFSRLEDIPLFKSSNFSKTLKSSKHYLVLGLDYDFTGAESIVSIVIEKAFYSDILYTTDNIKIVKGQYVLIELPDSVYEDAFVNLPSNKGIRITMTSENSSYTTFIQNVMEANTMGGHRDSEVRYCFTTGSSIQKEKPWFYDSGNYNIYLGDCFEFLLRYPENDWQEEYDVLEYIKSTGNQYIDTGFVPNQDTRIQFSGEVNKGDSYNFFFGAASSRFSNSIECYYVNGSDYVECYYGTQWVQISKASTGNRIDIDFNKNIHNVSINGTNYSKTYNVEKFNCPNTLCFFDLNRADTNHNSYTQPGHKMFSCKIYSYDMLIRDYVPVRKTSTGEIGLFDKVTKTFLKSVTTSLVAGPVISHNYNYNRWKQTANPLITRANNTQTAESMGYKPVEISWNSKWYYGMGLSSSSNSYLDCEAGHSNWYGAIGQNTIWNDGLPAPDGSVQKWIQLYIRIDNTNFNKQSSIRNNKAIFMDEFIEE